MTVTAEIETITPKKASAWLLNNTHNRNPKEKKIEQYAEDIRRGDWEVNGSSIVFNGKRLIDGQNRLMAVIKANKPIRSLVVKGVQAKAQETLDIGAARSFADTLRMKGHINATTLASMINFGMAYESGTLSQGQDRGFGHSRREQLRWLGDNEGVVEAVNFVIGNSLTRVGNGTAAAALQFYSEEDLPGEAFAFLEQVRKGENLIEGMPSYALKRWLENSRIIAKKPNRIVVYAMTIKAFNAFIEGKHVKNLSFKAGGASPEPFPTIVREYPW